MKRPDGPSAISQADQETGNGTCTKHHPAPGNQSGSKWDVRASTKKNDDQEREKPGLKSPQGGRQYLQKNQQFNVLIAEQIARTENYQIDREQQSKAD
jgi:hypothetical protein